MTSYTCTLMGIMLLAPALVLILMTCYTPKGPGKNAGEVILNSGYKFWTLYTAAFVSTLSGGIYQIIELHRCDVLFFCISLFLSLFVFAGLAGQTANPNDGFFKSMAMKRVVTGIATLATTTTTMSLAFGILDHNCHAFLVMMFVWPAILMGMAGTCIIKNT